MPKVVKAYDNNYKIAVVDGGTITLDTGNEEGIVRITGNLQVDGTQTVVNSTDLQIDDNIIVVSSQAGIPESDQTAGVPQTAPINGRAGLQIDRGSLINARWVYDENVTWQLGGNSGSGTFYAEQGNQKLPLNTPGIVAQGDLFVDTGAGIITVETVPNYEEGVFNYSNNIITADNNNEVLKNDDAIPNAKALVDYFEYTFNNRFRPRIAEGNTSVETIDEQHLVLDIVSINDEGNNTTVIETAGNHGFLEADTLIISNIEANGDPIEGLNGTNIGIIEIINSRFFRIDKAVIGGNIENYVENSGVVKKTGFKETQVEFIVEGNGVAGFFENRIDLQGIEIKDTKISTTASNESLILQSSGTGTVTINDILEITETPYDEDLDNPPSTPLEGVKIYTSEQNTGKTGIFYINKSATNDEIVSKNRSLLFSMLF